MASLARFTSLFVHIGLLHILFNMWALFGLGRLMDVSSAMVDFFASMSSRDSVAAWRV